MSTSKNLTYWYDEQIKRYLGQLIRIFSHFQVREYTRDGASFNRVPCRYADASRMVSHIMARQSENVVASLPMIALSIQTIQIARDRAQEPFFQDTRQVAEREFDRGQDEYTQNQGNLYTTQRYMPVPYNITLQVDILTSNTDSKLQIFEQIMVLFNPSLQLQSNDNPLDWSNIFEVELTDIQWSNRTQPVGTDDVLDIGSLTFQVPIWISPPAKVKRQSVIQRIVTDIYKVVDVKELDLGSDIYDFFEPLKEDGRNIVVPENLRVDITPTGAFLQTLGGQPADWQSVIDLAGGPGELRAVSRLEVNASNDVKDLTNLIIGSVSQDTEQTDRLIFTLDTDTLPSNTIDSVLRIINPDTSSPSNGLPSAELGQRYLFASGTQTGTPWGVIANGNDIVEYDGAEWVVVFDSLQAQQQEWVLNQFTGQQFKWTGSEWISSWQGTYNPGYWRLLL